MKIGMIEKDVSFPEVHSKFNFPWPEMDVGDSVFIKAGKTETVEMLKRKVKGSARYYGVKSDKRFSALVNREKDGVRVWRIE